MRQSSSRLSLALLTALGAVAIQAACGGGNTTPPGGNTTGTSSGGNGGTGGTNAGGNGGTGGEDCGLFGCTTSGGGSMQSQVFDVQPQAPVTITVQAGQTNPIVNYTATFGGNPAQAGWSVDRGEIGSITTGPSNTAVFTPKGTAGGLVHVRAGLNGQTVERDLFVKIAGQQNGADPNNPSQAPQIATTVPQLTEGGGIGGVGGEGLGVAVTDPLTVAVLGAPAGNGSAENLRFLYPYDRTVWPRGILAPLLMWDWSIGDADAIRIDLETTSGSFKWNGTFGRPAILAQTGKPFIRHPIPQDVWAMATNTAGSKAPDGTVDSLIVKLTVAKGNVAYGPITETWSVAPGRLSGIIYYNSYGTNLAKNYPGAVGGDGMFGGAVLSIKVGDTAPKLTAGKSGPTTECRVCHSVAANGSRLVTERNAMGISLFDLTPTGATESALPNGSAHPGITPDGSMALTTPGQLISLANGGAILPSSGMSAVATNVGVPSFSPDGKRVVINPTTSSSISFPMQKLLVLDFDSGSGVFSNPITVVDLSGQPATTRPGWAAFFPDGKSIIYHHQIAPGADPNTYGDLRTRKGAKAFLAMASTSGGEPVALNPMNGKDSAGNSYLPKLATPVSLGCTGDGVQVGGIDADHADDTNLNYEPTVSPIPAGGFAWVVLTSRRLYGNVATIPPFCSDPRGVDLISNITPKKLWVSAVDLNAPAGTDGSHPAFYLPAQELLAGNARGFWVFEPCREDGNGCETGDQCCNGFCSPNPSGMPELICSNKPPEGMCSGLQDKCTTTADCCDPTNQCINGFCALSTPK